MWLDLRKLLANSSSAYAGFEGVKPVPWHQVVAMVSIYTSSSGDYVIPRTLLNFGERAFNLCAPFVGNNLTCALEAAQGAAALTCPLETFLFKAA